MAEYSEDFDTEALIEFLDDLKRRVLRVLKENKINGRSFLTLTDEELKKLGMKDNDREELLKKIDEVKKTNKAKPEVCIIWSVDIIIASHYKKDSFKEQPKPDAGSEDPPQV